MAPAQTGASFSDQSDRRFRHEIEIIDRGILSVITAATDRNSADWREATSHSSYLRVLP